MGLRVQTNVEAFRSYRNLNVTTEAISKSQEKLSSGFRINRAADDAAGLAISLKLSAQVSGLGQAQRNAHDAISLSQTGEGAMQEVSNMLQRVRDLAVQFNNGTLSTSDRASITAEVGQLQAEIVRIGSDTKFNGISLLTGTSTVTFQIGADQGQTLTIGINTMYGSGSAFAIDSNIFNFTATSANIASVDTAIANIAKERADFGAVQNRLEYTLNNLAVYEENLSSSLSRIKDVDVAKEMVHLTKLQIVQQAGMSMLAQANQAPQNVLSLLQ